MRYLKALSLLLISVAASAQTVVTNGSNQATGINGIQIGDVIYDITSFNGTGSGTAAAWANPAEATAAANAINAALNAAGVTEIETPNPAKEFYCVGHAPGALSDAIESNSAATDSWELSVLLLGACTLGGLDYFTTWEVVSMQPGVANINSSGRVESIDGLLINGAYYNITSFNGTGAGEIEFWANVTEATAAHQAINAFLNANGFTDVETAGVGDGDKFYCVDYPPGSIDSFYVESTSLSLDYWRVTTGPWAGVSCFYGGAGQFTTWQLASPPPLDVGIDIEPGSGINIVHPHHDGSPSAVAGLNDVIPVVVLGADMLVGDPADFDPADIDTTSLSFGPAGAPLSPGSTPVYGLDYDSDGIPDARFEFLTGDAGLLCMDSEASLAGATIAGDGFAGTDSITPDCDAECHN